MKLNLITVIVKVGNDNMGEQNNPSLDDEEFFDFNSEEVPIGRATNEGFVPDIGEIQSDSPLNEEVQNKP